MRAKLLVLLTLVSLFLVCSFQPRGFVGMDAMHAADSSRHLRDVDIVQRTCALEVVLAVREIDAWSTNDTSPVITPIQLDARPGNTMLACLPATAK